MNDQFQHARLPLRPLSLKNAKLATVNELIIDYDSGDASTYHIYLSDSKDNTKLIDITQLMLTDMITKAKIDGNQLSITLEGQDGLVSIKDILNHIFKRYIYPENYGLFNPDDHMDKILNDETVTTLLRNSNGRVILPVTLADNIFFENGKTLKDMTNYNNTLTARTISVEVKSDCNSIAFDYPYENYVGNMEVRLNGIYLSQNDWWAEQNKINSRGDYETGTFGLIDSQLHAGDKLDFVFMYSTASYPDSAHIDGESIIVNSVPTSRLRTSDEYARNDSTTVATSKALYNMYNYIVSKLSDNADCVDWCTDTSEYQSFIHVESKKKIIDYDYFVINVLLGAEKRFDCTILVKWSEDAETEYELCNYDGSDLSKSLPAGKLVKLIWNKQLQKFILIQDSIKQTRFISRTKDDQIIVSFDGLAYNIGSVITVYRNGIRLFEDIDYYMNHREQTITLHKATTTNELIVFEALSN